ncbi:hypothetical protein RB195_024013 [Necator americanus]|uniref:Uncharacterized protein n=1 Tax=Necator americanus TaxID=51031 RepID=A0ABR1ELH9_NECAM
MCTKLQIIRTPVLGYLWPRVCHNEDLYAEINVVVVHEHLPKRAPPSPDPRTVINEDVVEDDRSPYPPYAMNRVGYLMLIRYPTLFIII